MSYQLQKRRRGLGADSYMSDAYLAAQRALIPYSGEGYDARLVINGTDYSSGSPRNWPASLISQYPSMYAARWQKTIGTPTGVIPGADHVYPVYPGSAEWLATQGAYGVANLQQIEGRAAFLAANPQLMIPQSASVTAVVAAIEAAKAAGIPVVTPPGVTLPGPSVSSWFTGSMIGGIPNWMLAAGVGAAAVFFSGGKRGR